MKAPDLLKVVAWTRFDLLRSIRLSREYGSFAELRAVRDLLHGLDDSLRIFAPDARASVFRESARRYRENVWLATVASVALPAGKLAGVPEFKFFGWASQRVTVPESGRSVRVAPVIGPELVEAFRATLAEVSA